MRAKLLVALSLAVFAFLSGCASQNTPGLPPPAFASGEKTVPLSRLVSYYEGKLDPAVPQITITVEQDGETYPLPYNGVVLTGNEGPEASLNRTWFTELMNNFQSLPRLRSNDLFIGPPAHFTIRFEQLPEGEVTIVDHTIFKEYGYTNTYYTEGNTERSKNNLLMHTKTFQVTDYQISSDLWLFAGLQSSSSPPPLLGLRMQCQYGMKKVEYYILFRNAHPYAEFPADTDFSHLTPLEP